MSSTLSVNNITHQSGSSVSLNSNFIVTGSTTLSGNTTVGNNASDWVVVNSVVSSSVIPHTHNVFDLGSVSKKWANLYVTTLDITSLTNASGSITIDGSGSAACGSGGEAIQLTGSTGIKGCLWVSGSIESVGDATIGGNLTVNGTTTTVNSTVMSVDDPIITLGGDTAPGSDDGKDRGVEFRYYSGTAKIGYFGYDNNTGHMTYIPSASNSSEVFAGSVGYLDVAGIQTSGSQDIIIDSSGGDLYLKTNETTGMHFDLTNKRLGIGVNTPAVALQVSGSGIVAAFSGSVDINGNELILDLDGDTSITADTDDQIDFKVGGSDKYHMTTAALYAISGNLGTSANPWNNLYTNDLHLKNDRGDWTIIEEEEYLSIRNNKTGKMFKLVMEEIE